MCSDRRRSGDTDRGETLALNDTTWPSHGRIEHAPNTVIIIIIIIIRTVGRYLYASRI